MSRRSAAPFVHRTAAPGVVLVAVLLAVSGCGGSGDQGGSGDAPPSNARAEQTVTDWLRASVEGDATACDLETRPFSDAANTATFKNIGRPGENGFSCPQRIKRSASVLDDIGGDDYADLVKGADIETVATSEDAASVRVTYNESGEPTTFGLVLDDDQWLIDSDSAIPSTVKPGSGIASG